MNYDTMEAGREMDALVAEKVMGLEYREMEISIGGGIMNASPKVVREWLWVSKDGDPGYVLDGVLKEYSVSISDAWEVVEKFDRFDVRKYVGGYGCQVALHGKTHLIIAESHATAPTAPLAICRAALRAVGEK